MRRGVKRVATLTTALVVVAILALPAVATVDEFTGMPCSGGNAVFAPPGISDETKGNFAKPLQAAGFATITPLGVLHDGIFHILVSFDEDHPASKIRLLGPTVEVEEGVFLTIFEWDDTKPFANCKNFQQPFGP